MKKQFLALVLLLILAATAYSAVTIGPMIHANFGGGEVKFSGGIEAAYWDVREGPWSIDLGLEFEAEKMRLYTEFQTGIVVAGFSIGPVLEFPTGNSVGDARLGLQSSVWGSYFAGIDVRLRYMGFGEYILSPGVFGKYPILTEQDGFLG